MKTVQYTYEKQDTAKYLYSKHKISDLISVRIKQANNINKCAFGNITRISQ